MAEFKQFLDKSWPSLFPDLTKILTKTNHHSIISYCFSAPWQSSIFHCVTSINIFSNIAITVSITISSTVYSNPLTLCASFHIPTRFSLFALTTGWYHFSLVSAFTWRCITVKIDLFLGTVAHHQIELQILSKPGWISRSLCKNLDFLVLPIYPGSLEVIWFDQRVRMIFTHSY